MTLKITALAGGIGGARFIRGLLAYCSDLNHAQSGGTSAEITVIGNTGDDIWMHGIKVCPDLDTVMYTLGDGIEESQGWGRRDETFTVKAELAKYGAGPEWFGLGDRDLATHLVRTRLLTAGRTLTEVTDELCRRWNPGVRLLPMSDQRVETHVIVDQPDDGRSAVHFQEWWVRYRASIPAHGFVMVGIDEAQPAPGVLDAILNCDVLLFPPSNPVVSIGSILSVEGIRSAVSNTPAPVIGVSPIIGGAPVRGMADACLTAIGVDTSCTAVAAHYGARTQGGLLDGWLIDSSDSECITDVESLGIACRAVPLFMTDVAAAAQMASEALALAEHVTPTEHSG